MKRLRWTPHALSQLDNIAAYIRERNPQATSRVLKRIRARVDQLAERPFIGRHGVLPGTRELIIGQYQYKVVYRVSEEIEIAAIFHTAQQDGD